MYTPNNLNMYCAAMAGALSGMEVFGRNPSRTDPAVYAGIAACAEAFAQAFDTVWASTPDNSLTVETVLVATAGFWEGRRPAASTSTQSPSFYLADARALFAIITAGSNVVAAQGITPPPFGGGGGGGAAGFAIFRPGLATAAPYYATWPEIVALVVAAAGAFNLYVDSSHAPAVMSADLDGLGRLNLLPAQGAVAGAPMKLTILDGIQLSHPAAIDGNLELFSVPTGVVAPLNLGGTNANQFFLSNGAVMTLGAGATRAFVDVAAGAANVAAMRFDFSSHFRSLAAPGVPFANLLAAGAVFSSFYTGISPFTQPQNELVTGPVGSTVIIVYDSSVNLPTYSTFSGTILTFQIDHGSVVKTVLDFTTARMQSIGGLAISSLYPFYLSPRPTAMFSGVDIEVQEELASPTMTASDAQVLDSSFVAFTGVCDTFTFGTGFLAPPPSFLSVQASTPTHTPNLLMTITGDTFANITAGHIVSTLLVFEQARAS